MTRRFFPTRLSGLVLLFLLATVTAHGGLRVEHSGVMGPESVTDTWEFPFEILRPEANYAVDVKAVLSQGSGVLRIVDPSGAELYQRLWGTRLSEDLAPLSSVHEAGQYTVMVETDGAVGEWRVRVAEVPKASQLRYMYVSGPLLALVGVAFVVGWRLYSHAPGRWFALGAVVRLLSLIPTLAFMVAYSMTVQDAMEDSLTHVQFLLAESAVVGLSIGTAMTIVLAGAGLVFRDLRNLSTNAVAVGVGAGAGEAIVSALGTHLGMVTMYGPGPKSAQAMLRLAYEASLTPWLLAVEPAKFACVTVCFMAASALVMLGLSTRRWSFPGYALVVVAGLYAGIGMTRILAIEGAGSRWWILSGALPFTALGVVILWRCLRTWPPALAPGEVPMEAYLKQFESEDGRS